MYSYTNSNGEAYYLNHRDVTLKNGNGTWPIYWFTRHQQPETSVSEVPAGYEVVENPRNRMPLLKKVR